MDNLKYLITLGDETVKQIQSFLSMSWRWGGGGGGGYRVSRPVLRVFDGGLICSIWPAGAPQLTGDPDERLSVSQALSHEWIAHWDSAPSLNRRTTLVRLTAFNGRRKLKGVVLGLIARKRYLWTLSLAPKFTKYILPTFVERNVK